MTEVHPLNETLSLIRRFHVMKQKDAAKRLDIGQSYLSEIESGRKKVTLDILDRYAEVFKLRPWQIVLISEHLNDPKAITTSTSVSPKVNRMIEWLEVISDVGTPDVA